MNIEIILVKFENVYRNVKIFIIEIYFFIEMAKNVNSQLLIILVNYNIQLSHH